MTNGLHPVYTSHLPEIQAVYRSVARISIRQEAGGAPGRSLADRAFIRDLHTELCRIYLMFATTAESVIHVCTADLDFIKKIVAFYKLHPECGGPAPEAANS